MSAVSTGGPGVERRPLKRSVSVLVWSAGGGRLLAVRRPPNDEDLPGVWGLPAASLRSGEDWADAAERVGPEKLGVDLSLGAVLREGRAERPTRRLRMRLFEAEIAAGSPHVPQDVEGVTQYVDWAWAPPGRLREAARAGSLCSRLCLDYLEGAENGISSSGRGSPRDTRGNSS